MEKSRYGGSDPNSLGSSGKLPYLKKINTAAYVLMIAVNILAQALPLNGVKTGEVSDSYPNLFTPSPATFAVWGLIYLLLAGFVLYQLGAFSKNSVYRADVIVDIGLWFAFSCLANTVWIFAWHYRMIWASAALILLLLFSLAVIVGKIQKYTLSRKEKIFISLPFSVYYAWITIAVIANITVLFVSMGFNGGPFPPQAWTVAVLLVGLVIGLLVMTKNRDVAYGITLIWSYAGILIRHLSKSGFSGRYPSVITAAAVCILLLAVVVMLLLVSRQDTPANAKQRE